MFYKQKTLIKIERFLSGFSAFLRVDLLFFSQLYLLEDHKFFLKYKGMAIERHTSRQ